MYSYMCGTAVMAELVNYMRVVNAHLRLSLSFSLSLSLSLSFLLFIIIIIIIFILLSKTTHVSNHHLETISEEEDSIKLLLPLVVSLS